MGTNLHDVAPAVLPMTAVEYLVNNRELRSFVEFFNRRPDCTGITWSVEADDSVEANQVIGHFTFNSGTPVAIRAPVHAVVVRTYDPDIAQLSFRPSQTIALFELISDT